MHHVIAAYSRMTLGLFWAAGQFAKPSLLAPSRGFLRPNHFLGYLSLTLRRPGALDDVDISGLCYCLDGHVFLHIRFFMPSHSCHRSNCPSCHGLGSRCQVTCLARPGFSLRACFSLLSLVANLHLVYYRFRSLACGPASRPRTPSG